MTKPIKEKERNPLVSIITVCKNSEKTIEHTIESVIKQTYSNIEYLIIDGGSTDRTIEILKHYDPKFKGRMRWISEKDSGIYYAMNKGLYMAKGELIGILNSDDWYERNAVELVAESYKKHGESVYYGILRYYENDVELMLKTVQPQSLRQGIMLPHPTCFIHRAIYNKNGNYDLQYKLSSDYEFLVRLYLQGIQFVQIDRVIANFRVGGLATRHDSLSTNEVYKIMYKYRFISRRDLFFIVLKNKIKAFFAMLGFKKKGVIIS